MSVTFSLTCVPWSGSSRTTLVAFRHARALGSGLVPPQRMRNSRDTAAPPAFQFLAQLTHGGVNEESNLGRIHPAFVIGLRVPLARVVADDQGDLAAGVVEAF